MQKEELMRRAIAVSENSVRNGGGPFGAVIASKDGEIIAVHCSRYTYDGTLLIYQGYWTNKQYSHDGILYYESLQKENIFMQYLMSIIKLIHYH